MAKVVTQKKQYVPKSAYNKKSHFSDYMKLNEEYFKNNPNSMAADYNREQRRKPKKVSKLIVNTLVICSLVVFVVLASVLCSIFSVGGGSGYVETLRENPHKFAGLGIEPSLETSTKIKLNGRDPKAQAAQLYDIASENATKTPYFCAYNAGLLFLQMGGNDNYLDIDSVILKSQDEYFSIVYHLKNSVPILDSFMGPMISKTTDVITTERYYASKNSSSLTYQKVKNNGYDDDNIPYASWDSKIPISTPTIRNLPLITFNASQKGTYRITNHTITEDTISSATVTHDRNGFYVVSAVLDHNNPETIKKSLADITTGTGDKNAYYTAIELEYTVWDNGYLRTFNLKECWSANVIIDLAFNLQTNWQCSYLAEDCNHDEYHDCKIMKEFLGI